MRELRRAIGMLFCSLSELFSDHCRVAFDNNISLQTTVKELQQFGEEHLVPLMLQSRGELGGRSGGDARAGMNSMPTSQWSQPPNHQDPTSFERNNFAEGPSYPQAQNLPNQSSSLPATNSFLSDPMISDWEH